MLENADPQALPWAFPVQSSPLTDLAATKTSKDDNGMANKPNDLGYQTHFETPRLLQNMSTANYKWTRRQTKKHNLPQKTPRHLKPYKM